jgi:hypothetical protein
MRPVFRPVCTALALLAVPFALSACGDDEDNGDGGQAAQLRTVEFSITGSGRQTEMTAPRSVEGGVVRVRFSNEAQGDHGLQLAYVDEGRSPQEGLRMGAAWGEEGRPLPDWVHFQGGVGSIRPGTAQSVTQELPAGRYVAVDIDSNAAAFFEVTEGEGGEEPSAPGTIEASEYKFESSGLQSGRRQVVVDNVGAEPHFVAAGRLKPGKTIDDVRRFIRTEEGEEPFVEEGSFDTAIVDGGVKQAIELNVPAGEYAFMCFIPDRAGGPPHVAKGMISAATVEG